jgi:hypothetical protein
MTLCSAINCDQGRPARQRRLAGFVLTIASRGLRVDPLRCGARRALCPCSSGRDLPQRAPPAWLAARARVAVSCSKRLQGLQQRTRLNLKRLFLAGSGMKQARDCIMAVAHPSQRKRTALRRRSTCRPTVHSEVLLHYHAHPLLYTSDLPRCCWAGLCASSHTATQSCRPRSTAHRYFADGLLQRLQLSAFESQYAPLSSTLVH